MDRRKDIINTIRDISGRYSEYQVFSDWIQCSSLAISNGLHKIRYGIADKNRERDYMDIAKKYSDSEMWEFAEMVAMLAETLEYEITDALGWIYMYSGMGSKAAGQFFTPFHLSLLCAEAAVGEPDENGIYYIKEPSCGGGGMIIAAARALKDRGVDYQSKMRVVAQDLDWRGVYMCYLQLSLLGINAVCIQGDALADTSNWSKNALYTPMAMGVIV